MTATGAPHVLHSRRGRQVLALLCAVAFLDFIDASITNVALPHILTSLHFTTQSLQWVPSAYLLTYGGFMLLGGRLSDLLGRRRVMLTGTVLVGLSSLVGGFAGNEGVFLSARLVQGLGAALMLPAALSTLTTTFTSGKDRQSALGVWAAVAGLASAAGILLGGVLTEGPGWRWVMFVNPIACVLVVPAVLRLLPRDLPAVRRARLDLLGSALVTTAMLLLVFALVRAPEQGWGSGRTWAEVAAAAVLLIAFVLVERSVAEPILPLSIFRVPGLAAANLTGLIGFAGMLSMFYFLTLYMQTVLHFSPIEAGAAYLPLTFAIGISAGIGAKLITAIGSRAVISAGALFAAAGLFLLAQITVHGGYPSHILPGLLLVALGIGPVFVGVTTAANAGVDPGRAGVAAAILNSSQQIGGALGLAVFSAAGTARVHHLLSLGRSAPVAATGGIRVALATGAAFSVAAALIALVTRNTHDDPQAVPDDTETQEPRRILVIGRSPGVLLDAVALLRADGYVADATNQFDAVLAQPDEFDVARLDIVVFGGFVPPAMKELLREELAARNAQLRFVQGLAGMPGLIADQVRGALGPSLRAGDEVGYDPNDRLVRVTLVALARVAVEAFWATSLVPPEPKSTARVVQAGDLAAGSYEIRLPEDVPHEASFVTVTVDTSVLAFTVGPMPHSVTRLVPNGSAAVALPPPPALNTRAGQPQR